MSNAGLLDITGPQAEAFKKRREGQADLRRRGLLPPEKKKDARTYLIPTRPETCYRLTNPTYVRAGEKGFGRHAALLRRQPIYELSKPIDFFLRAAPSSISVHSSRSSSVQQLLRHQCPPEEK